MLLIDIFLSNYIFGQIPELKVLSLHSAEINECEAKTNFFHSNYALAEARYFEKLEDISFTNKDFLYFASSLAANNKPILALEFYNEYNSKTTNQSIDPSSLFSDLEPRYYQTNESRKIANTNPTLSGTNVYIPSDRYFKHYEIDCNGIFTNAKNLLELPVGTIAGSASFFDDNKKAVVSIIDLTKNSVSLYYYYFAKGKWKKPIKLFKNSGQYAFPYVDEKNQTLYFSADIPGGYGGYDVYVSTFSGVNFSTPINLGNHINTEMNEINPMLADEWLYLSSNGYVSKGGYDIYKYKNIDGFSHVLENCNEWNSPSDEIGLLYQNKSQVQVIKHSVKNTELVSFKRISYKSEFTGLVVNENNNPISDIVILCLENNTFTITDKQGNYSFNFEQPYQSIDIRVLHADYKSLDEQIINGKSDTIKLFFESSFEETPTEIKVEQLDTNSSFASQEHADDFFIVLGSSYNYEDAYELWSEWNMKFKNSEILETATGIYRIVIKSGKSEEQALIDFTEARKKKADIWILRPQSR